MKPNILLYSLYHREHYGFMNIKKPLNSFSLSEKINSQRLSDTFLGFTINCDFIISVSYESISTENIFTGSYTNLFLNFNTSPLFNNQITMFHQIYLGKYENSLVHLHFYQSVLNSDFFILTITEINSDILFILFGNMPQLNCNNCQNKSCEQHGIAASQSYQLPVSEIPYFCKIHQVTAIYLENQSLVIVVADNENNIRFINFQFPYYDPINYFQLCKYPKSMFPFSLSLHGNKIIENYCDCFYDRLINSDCEIAKSTPTRRNYNSKKCQLCLSRFVNTNSQLYYHKELANEIIDKCHDVDESHTRRQYKRIFLQKRESVFTCKPCSKKTYLSDINASYQNMILYKLNVRNSRDLVFEYDEIHGDISGISNVDGTRNYQWSLNHMETMQASLMNEELVINTSSWFPALDTEIAIHCLGMATGKLSPKKLLLIHLINEAHGISYIMELDINTGSAKLISENATSTKFCKFVDDVQICTNPFVLDLNNDMQVLTGKSLQSLTDYSGLIELKH